MTSSLNIPIFPLNGVIFFPQTNLPLNIFEDRYLEMVDFSLKNNRSIGMIQKNKSGKFFSTGCVGKINSFSETEDGRYVINLVGQNYFSIKNTQSDLYKFIYAKIDIIKNDETLISDLSNFNIKLLIEKYVDFINNKGIQVDLNIIEKITNTELIKFVAMSCPFSTEDKQMLLETFNIQELGNKLIGLFEFYHELKSKKSLN